MPQDKLKIIVLLVLWSQGKEPDGLIFDELFQDDDHRNSACCINNRQTQAGQRCSALQFAPARPFWHPGGRLQSLPQRAYHWPLDNPACLQ